MVHLWVFIPFHGDFCERDIETLAFGDKDPDTIQSLNKELWHNHPVYGLPYFGNDVLAIDEAIFKGLGYCAFMEGVQAMTITISGG